MKKIDILEKVKGIKIDKGTALTIGSIALSIGATILSGMNKKFEVKQEYDAVLDKIVKDKVKDALKNR